MEVMPACSARRPASRKLAVPWRRIACRNWSVEALRELGYTVLHAGTGAEAIRIIESGQGVTLLFTDLVMPGITGRELALLARRRLPELKLLYTTGYTASPPVAAAVPDGSMPTLQKPFSFAQLARKLREVLDG